VIAHPEQLLPVSQRHEKKFNIAKHSVLMVNIGNKDNNDVEKLVREYGKISGGSSVVTDEKVTKNKITGGSVVIVNSRVDVGMISGGAVVICFGEIKVNKISGGASVISNTEINAEKVGTSANVVAAPEVTIEGREKNIVSVERALNDSRVKAKIETKFGINLDGEQSKQLLELVERDN
jgi:hypothetical protein